jgi:glycosyltransferase involved in cell wall biosynthesis
VPNRTLASATTRPGDTVYHGLRIVVVVPAFNEEHHVKEVIVTMPAIVDAIVVVDDGSTDGTAATIEALQLDNVVLERHLANVGVGIAKTTGFRRALRDGADVVVVMDGDGQMDPDQLSALIEPVAGGRCEFAKGNRLTTVASTRGMPPVRLLGNVAMTLGMKAATGYWRMRDPQNAYIAVRASTLAQLPLESFENGYLFDNDLLIHLSRTGARVIDVPMVARYGTEVSSLRIGQFAIDAIGYLGRAVFDRVFDRLSH